MSYETNPTNTDDPEALRREIERTRGNLSQNVNALGEAVDPSNVARRQAEKVQDRVMGAGRGIKERIMGSDDEGYYDPGYGYRYEQDGTSMGDRMSDAGDRLRDAAGTARSNVEQAPAMARRRAQGNPLAAGLIALGAGWLVGSLLPVSDKERELAVRAKETAADKGQPLVEGAKALAQESADNLRQPLQHAAESLKDSAQQSMETVRAEGKDAAATVTDQAKDAKDTVKDQQKKS